jgi:hypothetical protein
MLDFINDDYITVDLNNKSGLPQWFQSILVDVVKYYNYPVRPLQLLTPAARHLVDECLKKRGFEFEYYKLDCLKRSNSDHWNGEIFVIPEGYVFKSTPELSAYIIKVTGNEHER